MSQKCKKKKKQLLTNHKFVFVFKDCLYILYYLYCRLLLENAKYATAAGLMVVTTYVLWMKIDVSCILCTLMSVTSRFIKPETAECGLIFQNEHGCLFSQCFWSFVAVK